MWVTCDAAADTATVVTPATIKAEADKKAAAKVDALIAAIGTVDATSEAKIIAAEEAYAALTADQQALVADYATLTAARAAYDLLVAPAPAPVVE